MKIGLFTGTALRHIYYANTILKRYKVDLHVRVLRSDNLADEVKFACSNSDKELLKEHGASRLEKEKEYFLPLAKEFIKAENILETTAQNFNSPDVIAKVKEHKLDLALVYGTSLLSEEFLQALPEKTINLHAGLNPNYRGAATLYWPIYFMEPQCVGFTFHLIDKFIDHGKTIHQGRPEIFKTDLVHDLGCRTIVRASEDILKIIKLIEEGNLKYFTQSEKGKIFYTKDFKPHHLRVTNFLMEKGLLKEYLENKEFFPDPDIKSQV